MSAHLSAIDEAERAGIDLSVVEANLSRSYEERILRHEQALAILLELEGAGWHVIGRLLYAITYDDMIRAREMVGRGNGLLTAREWRAREDELACRRLLTVPRLPATCDFAGR